MLRKVQVTVHRVTREHAVVEMQVDDERGTHQSLHNEAATLADEADNCPWEVDSRHIDHFASHFEWQEARNAQTS